MATDMESVEQDAYLDSSRGRSRKSNSDRSTRRSRGNSGHAQGEGDGEAQEPRPTSIDVLLSLLLSDLGEIQDFGGEVKFFDNPVGLIIQLPGARLCKIHRQIHSGEICPHC